MDFNSYFVISSSDFCRCNSFSHYNSYPNKVEPPSRSPFLLSYLWHFYWKVYDKMTLRLACCVINFKIFLLIAWFDIKHTIEFHFFWYFSPSHHHPNSAKDLRYISLNSKFWRFWSMLFIRCFISLLFTVSALFYICRNSGTKNEITNCRQTKMYILFDQY